MRDYGAIIEDKVLQKLTQNNDEAINRLKRIQDDINMRFEN